MAESKEICNIEDGEVVECKENQGLETEENLAILSVEETRLLLCDIPEILTPTSEWQKKQIVNFTNIRIKIFHLLENESNRPRKGSLIVDDKGWSSFFEDKEATIPYVLAIKMTSNKKLGLEYLISILAGIKPGDTIPVKIEAWIYAYMLCIEKPISSETIWFLRSVAFKCSEIRANLNVNDDNAKNLVKPLNLFICLVAMHFRPLDMAI